ncbi:MAG: hypothetical protein ACE5HH_02065 [Candidatus Hydrothermarchaeales archaeon]
MARKDLTPSQIEAMIIYRLARRGAWGEAYMPKDTLIRRLARKIKNNGKNVRRVVNSLIREGFLLSHKGGRTISLNPSKKNEILLRVSEILP